MWSTVQRLWRQLQAWREMLARKGWLCCKRKQARSYLVHNCRKSFNLYVLLFIFTLKYMDVNVCCSVECLFTVVHMSHVTWLQLFENYLRILSTHFFKPKSMYALDKNILTLWVLIGAHLDWTLTTLWNQCNHNNVEFVDYWFKTARQWIVQM